jgi:microcystin-dependent protein
MSLADLQSALNMRDLIVSIVEEAIDRIRPEEKIGKIWSWDSNTGVAKVLLAGENVDNLVNASFGRANAPRLGMSTTFSTAGYAADSDIVRVGGRPGAYRVLDYVSGGPENWYTKDIGFIKMWPGASLPADHFWCNGLTYSGNAYPMLASVLGDAFGTHSGDVYYLPDYRGRSPIGVGAAVPAAGGNNYARGQKWGDERLPSHSHTGLTGTETADHSHNFVSYGYTNQFGWSDTGGLYPFPLLSGANGAWGGQGRNAAHQHYFTTDSAGTVHSSGNVHPVIGTQFVIRAK